MYFSTTVITLLCKSLRLRAPLSDLLRRHGLLSLSLPPPSRTVTVRVVSTVRVRSPPLSWGEVAVEEAAGLLRPVTDGLTPAAVAIDELLERKDAVTADFFSGTVERLPTLPLLIGVVAVADRDDTVRFVLLLAAEAAASVFAAISRSRRTNSSTSSVASLIFLRMGVLDPLPLPPLVNRGMLLLDDAVLTTADGAAVLPEAPRLDDDDDDVPVITEEEVDDVLTAERLIPPNPVAVVRLLLLPPVVVCCCC